MEEIAPVANVGHDDSSSDTDYVSPPLTLSSKVQLVQLASDNDEPTGGVQSVAIGWGSSCYECSGIPDLQKVNLRIYSHSECQNILGNGFTQDMVCSGLPEEHKGICAGDSGGALLINGVQVGITSWTVLPCADYPAVWTKLSHYRDWIRANTGV
ncbi:Glandular kallikrein-7 [Blattella germanica]|nr:Glandular kallikrein-7 [Blattella germanica]